MKNNTKEVMSEDGPKYRFTVGTTSLLLLFLIGGTFAVMMHWSSQPHPQFQGEMGWGSAIVFFIMFALVLPTVMIASFVTGAMAIVKNRGRTEGIIALSAIGIIVFLLVITGVLH